MKSSHLFLQSIFPLPKSMQQLIQAEAFLLISPQPQIPNHPTPTFIRCMQYPTQREAMQNQIKYTSLSNAFHLQIRSSKIKHIQSSLAWCLIIEMQAPNMSLKQKINMNKKASRNFTQNELVMIVNCMNLLFIKYFTLLESGKITANQLIDNIFVTQNQLIKLSVPSLVCPLKEKAENKLLLAKNRLLKFAMVLIQVLKMKEHDCFQEIDVLKRTIESLKFERFCLKELKNHLLSKLSLYVTKSIYNKSFQMVDKSGLTQVNQNQSFPKRKFSKKSKLNNNKNNQKVSKTTKLQSQRTTIDELSGFSNNISLNFKTLNEMADNKFAQSFQQDQYSYILQSQNTSPIRISPHKGSVNREIDNVVNQKQQQQQKASHSGGKFSPLSFQSQVSPQLQNSHQMHKPSVSGYGSIIFQVQQESNYELIQAGSMCSDLIELSFSREKEDDQSKFGDLRVQQIVNEQEGTRYYGEVRNGLRQGRGKLFYNDGGYYEGDWRNDSITGFGRLFYPSGKLAYAGYWHKGSFHGPGLVLNQNIDSMPADQSKPFDYTNLQNLGRTWVSYRGNFNMDVRQGFGVVKLQNGDSISGVWEDNCLNGQGQYRGKNGLIIKGIWKMNKLVNVLCQGEK